MCDTDEVSGQSITSAVILYFSGFWRQSIDHAYCTHVDIAEQIFRDAANVVAGQTVGDSVMTKSGMFGGGVINAAQTVNTRGDPQASLAIGVEIGDRACLNAVFHP